MREGKLNITLCNYMLNGSTKDENYRFNSENKIQLYSALRKLPKKV